MADVFAPILNSPEFTLAKQLCFLFYFVFSVALIFWTWRDASKRGAMAWFWALVALFFNVAGWAIYLIVRPPEYAADVRERELEIQAKEASLQREVETCPACLKPVEKDYLICPSCMKKLRKQCTECGRALKLDWGVCPYCKTKQ
ncbi:MAG: zinc ribbon domain-containing protein [Actinobacteria bacterium]|nr:MAG: zinc ribbon domain-containing protein [Actinomycetota bacterium]